MQEAITLSESKRAKLANDWASRSYRMTHGTFERYCREVHGISGSYAYMLLGGRRSSKHPISETMRWSIWERDNFTCRYCGARQFLTVDHVIAESVGGPTTPDNLVTCCRKCNRDKRTDTVEFFQFRRAFSMFNNLFGNAQ